MVPKTGVEPVRYRYHRILSPARLPIPSLRHGIIYYTKKMKSVNRFLIKKQSIRYDNSFIMTPQYGT